MLILWFDVTPIKSQGVEHNVEPECVIQRKKATTTAAVLLQSII
jgi:hypothetical protein